MAINITLNGESRSFSAPLTPSSLLEQLELDQQALIVELNQTILDKRHYADRLITDGDRVELIRFMGGG